MSKLRWETKSFLPPLIAMFLLAGAYLPWFHAAFGYYMLYAGAWVVLLYGIELHYRVWMLKVATVLRSGNYRIEDLL